MSDSVNPTAFAKAFTERHIGESTERAISYQHFDKARLRFGVPVDKTPDPVLGIPAYAYVPIQYEYDSGTQGKTVASKLFVVGPKMTSPKGVFDNYDSKDKDKKGPIVGQSIGSEFDLNNERHVKFMQVLIDIYIETVRFLLKTETRSTPVGAKLSRFYKGLAHDIDIDGMTNPEVSWTGCSFIISYRKEGEKYILTSIPSIWSNLRKGRKPTLFIDKKVKMGEDGQPLLGKDGKKQFTYTEIDKTIIEISSLTGYCCYDIDGINANTNTAKIKVVLDSMTVKSVSSKMSSIKRELADAEDSDEEDLDCEELANAISVLLPEAEANAQAKAERKQQQDLRNKTSSPDSVATTAASIGLPAFGSQQSQQQQQLQSQQFFAPPSQFIPQQYNNGQYTTQHQQGFQPYSTTATNQMYTNTSTNQHGIGMDGQ